MSLSVVVPPATEPISLDEAKHHLRVETTEDDQLIQSLIESCRQRAEDYTRRAFITQTLRYTTRLSRTSIDLPMPPLQQVKSVALVAHDGSETLLGSGEYTVLTDVHPAPLFLHRISGGGDHLRVEYLAGYGQEAADVPQAIREAILLMVGHYYENRESQEMPPEAMLALKPYRIVRIT